MQRNTHLRRFFSEVYNDPKMYEDYVEGKIILDFKLYNEWYQKLDIRNRIFARSVKEFTCSRPREFVMESAINDKLTVSQYLFGKSEVYISDFGKPEIITKNQEDLQAHYICNGYFNDTLQKINQVLNKGSFTVGICSEKNTKLYKEVISYYNKLKMALLKNGYISSSLEISSISKNRVYLLMYNGEKRK